jgi:hypothetical protein
LQATVRNNGACTVTSPWQVNLQMQRNWRNFNTVATQTGSGVFPPGDTIVQGDFCYTAPPNASTIRVDYRLTSSERACNPDPVSEMITPCEPVDPCVVP